MQTENATVATDTVSSDAETIVIDTTSDAPTVETAAVAKPKRVRKPKQAAPVTPADETPVEIAPVIEAVKPAKPTQADREQAQRDRADASHLARQCASRAVSEFYSGASRPFKSASDRFSDINPANGKSASARQAGLMLALITYGAGNMRSDGTFVRGGFVVPASLVNPNAKPGETVRAQPESGCLGNMLGRSADYITGPRSGRDQATAIYQLRVPVALAEIQAAFGDAAAGNARKLLESFDEAA